MLSTLIFKKYQSSLALLAIITLTIVFTPYYFGVNDHAYKIAFYKAKLDPTLYVNDLTVNLRNYYISFVDYLVLSLVPQFGLEDAFYFLHVIFRICFFCSIYYLARSLTGYQGIALLSVIGAVRWEELVGGIANYDFIFQERDIASSLILLACGLLVNKKYYFSGFLTGIATSFHPLVAINYFLVLAVYFVSIFFSKSSNRQVLVRNLLKFSVFPIIFLIIVAIVKVGNSTPKLFDPDWLGIVLMRSPNHLSLDYSRLIIQLIGGSLLLFRMKKIKQGGTLLYYVLQSSLLAVLLAVLINSFLLHIFPLTLGIQFNLLRVDYYLYFALLISSLVVLASNQTRAISLLFTFSWLILGAPYRLIVIACDAAYSFFRRSQDNLSFSKCALGILLLFPLPVILATQDTPSTPSFASMKKSANYEMQLWINKHLSKEAIMIAPPYLFQDDFRIYSERAILATWKDWTYSLVSRDFAFEMESRLKDLCGYQQLRYLNTCQDDLMCKLALCRNYYSSLNDRQLSNFTAKYQADYLIRENRRKASRLSFPVVYKNKKFSIYQLHKSSAE